MCMNSVSCVDPEVFIPTLRGRGARRDQEEGRDNYTQEMDLSLLRVARMRRVLALTDNDVDHDECPRCLPVLMMPLLLALMLGSLSQPSGAGGEGQVPSTTLPEYEVSVSPIDVGEVKRL